MNFIFILLFYFIGTVYEVKSFTKYNKKWHVFLVVKYIDFILVKPRGFNGFST
ncbi:hypothetical protein CFB3_13070 [Clostridium folliculivorans]|uniref:Uncharacterized protein n=1 Tax=Clostridium folliculivorans TaxID=2886038 RepID=A0A9W6DCG0_9CLOT|nr:hypothetical protein CFOLD11_37840 [Clostridium folliculivorans]GKU29201.1 hypothetical protein CFB3_13070 [Clostridium folliculivorans]